MRIKLFQFNMFPVNTYVLSDETSGEAVTIDAGCYYPEEQQELKRYIQANGLQVKRLLNTHLHLDHIFGNAFVSREFHVEPEASADDEFLIDRAAAHCNMFGFKINEQPAPLGGYLNDGDLIHFGTCTLQVISTPGHSPGGVVFYDSKNGCMFCGDTLFQCGMGRTDLDGGSYTQLIDSIKHRLFVLPDETVVYPGHGSSTTIGNEKTSLYIE